MYDNLRENLIKPTGWLRQQLEIQAKGLSGNLDKIWPDIKDSAWIGGNKDGWERVPYWLDGFLPLAYLLEDEDMIARADQYINAILARQQADGWICPSREQERKDYDLWALFLIGKVLALYCELTDSNKAVRGLYRAMQCLKTMLDEKKVQLFGWGKFRWFEALIPLQFLYDRYHEAWIPELGKELRRQGADYAQYTEQWKVPLNQWTMETHVVNIGMMLKYEALCCRLFGEQSENKAEQLWKILEKHNGTAVGVFTGDECLSGLANNQGTELCSVAELMYSCELLYAVTGKPVWADRLEKIAFNALPATLSDDMWTHQYDQMANQIACQRFPGRSMFRTNGPESHLFGLEPNFGCCTANFNQAWPKLAYSIFRKTDRGILCGLMLPSELHTRIRGVNVTLKIETEYPFRNLCKYIVTVEQPVAFELQIRIPGWAKSYQVSKTVYGKKRCHKISKQWQGTEEILVELERTPHLVNRPYGLKTVEYGPLVFALPIETEYKMLEYERDGVVRKYPYCDYELIPQGPWNYGFSDDCFEILEQEGDEIPFSSRNPRISIRASLSRIDWGYADGYTTVAAQKPRSRIPLGEPEEKELVPYGCAKLRMTEMPVITKRHPLAEEST